MENKEKISMLCIKADQHKRLKMIAVKNGETMRELTTRIFEKFLTWEEKK